MDHYRTHHAGSDAGETRFNCASATPFRKVRPRKRCDRYDRWPVPAEIAGWGGAARWIARRGQCRRVPGRCAADVVRAGRRPSPHRAASRSPARVDRPALLGACGARLPARGKDTAAEGEHRSTPACTKAAAGRAAQHPRHFRGTNPRLGALCQQEAGSLSPCCPTAVGPPAAASSPA